MCGIVGLWFKDPARSVAPDEIERMCDAIVHRGPDDSGIHVDGNFGMGMRRLSIVDLAGGHQPIWSESGDVGVVYNGEIYNYRDLRDELTFPDVQPQAVDITCLYTGEIPRFEASLSRK